MLTFSRILAIESSCDETAVAIVEKVPNQDGVHVLQEKTATSLQEHRQTLGIVPEVAARAQLGYILPLISSLKVHPSSIDAIAITNTPGLIGSLLVGVESARTLSFAWQKPLLPVHHVSAHLYAHFIDHTPRFPLLSWTISGGHTELRYLENHQHSIVVAQTVDDAIGECIDKCGRYLGLPYPAGPAMEELAGQVDNNSKEKLFRLSRPLLGSHDGRLSFSGLKTAFTRMYEQMKGQNVHSADHIKACLAAELQSCLLDILIDKTADALDNHPATKTVLLSGGVAANHFIQSSFEKYVRQLSPSVDFHFPEKKWCGDNAAIIGAYGIFHPELMTTWQSVQAIV
jgi:N6-L-threonylcarbamoyladenine synthase